jgi:hypothetical protein
MMCNFLKPKPPLPQAIGSMSNVISNADNNHSVEAKMNELELEWHIYTPAELVVYSSDEWNLDAEDEGNDGDDESERENPTPSPNQLLTSQIR